MSYVWVARLRVVLLALVVVGCVLPGVASGDVARRLGFGFGGSGEGAGELDLVSPLLERLEPFEFTVGGSGVAVNAVTGDVYVADTGNRRVDEFEAGGVFMRAWGWGVADGAAKLESCGPDAVPVTVECRRGLAGAGAGELSAPRFLAVDNSGGVSQGGVYVGDGVGSEAQNELQLVELGGASGGTFTLSYEGHTTSPIPFARRSPHDEDAAATAEALDAATGEPVFSVREKDNEDQEVVALEVEFVGALSETAAGLLGCGGSGLAPVGSKCEVLVDRVGSKFVGEVVSKFSGVGVLESSWGVGGQLDGGAAPAGVFRGQLNGVTVDPAGVLWVYDDAEMYGFEADGGFARDCRVGFGSASGLASGASAGEVYLVKSLAVDQHVHVCEGTEVVSVVAEAPALPPTGIGGDGSGGVLVDEGGSVVDAAVGVSEPPSFGPVAGGLGVGVGGEGGAFVASATEEKIDFFGVSLEAETLAGGEVTAGSATVNGEVNAKGTEVVSCVFQYGVSEAYGRRVPCVPAAPITGSASVKVHAAVTGLAPGTGYDYRLRLVNRAGEALATNDEQLSTVAAGVVEEAATATVEPTSAVLSAGVNPEGVGDTKCRIEYGTSTAYGSSAACEPGENLATENKSVLVGLRLAGLTAGDTYHWRVVLSDEHDASIQGPDNTFVYLAKSEPPPVERSCPNEALRSESDSDPVTGRPFSSELPDCRAYEMVTPVDKDGALLAPVVNASPVQISGEGTRVIADSLQCFARARSCAVVRGEFGAPFEFSRGEAGWVTTPLEPAASEHAENSQWSANAQTGVALFSAPVAGQPSDTFFAREPGGAFEAIGLVSEALPSEDLRSFESVATADLSHLVFWDPIVNGLWPSLIGEGQPVYEYVGRGNSRPFMVDVEGGEYSTKTIGDCTNLLGSLGERATDAYLYALSADGRTVYFEVCAGGEEDGPGGELYARVDGESADARTVAVSGHAAGGGAGPGECGVVCAASPASGTGLEGVSEDGSRVFFTSAQRLTNDASEDEAADAARGCTTVAGAGGCNLYLYEDPREDGRLVDVSAGDVSGLGPEVQGVMGVSADGSHVYFVAKGVLAGANTEGVQPAEGADNLYMYERDAAYPGGRTVFIATLPGDATSGQGEVPETEQWTGHGGKGANVTPDGDFLSFTSHGALTADDSAGFGAEQVYWYDAVTGVLARVSVGEHGFNDDGNLGAGGARIAQPNSKIGQPRRDPSMSDDGSLLFFQSPVGLTARALNDVALNGGGDGYDLAQNVYEWQAPGTHGCEEPAGCIFLISDGLDASETGGSTAATDSSVELLGTDASGGDVFFSTADRLVPGDTDSELDYYDARVDGGFPAPSVPPTCEGEACHEQGPAAGVFASPLSETLTGVGNLVSNGSSKPPPPRLTRAQLLAKALAGCHRDRVRRRRVACEKTARKRYGPVKRAHRAARSGSARSGSARSGSARNGSRRGVQG
jgi:hypothetical protein